MALYNTKLWAYDPEHGKRWVQMAEEERGGGIGRRLLAAIQRLALSTRMAALMLTVQTSNTAAREFYTRCG